MIINVNTQLGLVLNEPNVELRLWEAIKRDAECILGKLKIVDEKGKQIEKDGKPWVHVDFDTTEDTAFVGSLFEMMETRKRIQEKTKMNDVHPKEGQKYFFICESVYKAAELIKIGDKFTGRIGKDIKPGKYTYLMGKTKAIRFLCENNAVIGYYFDDARGISFEWGMDIETGEYFFSPQYADDVKMILQLLVFIELGDIDVKMLEAGRNNGKPKKSGKITNDSRATVYVVDSNWNTITIRTDGFGVRGHFRLQACGVGMIDRKLIWINAFEKHGYTRRPTGEIVK